MVKWTRTSLVNTQIGVLIVILLSTIISSVPAFNPVVKRTPISLYKRHQLSVKGLGLKYHYKLTDSKRLPRLESKKVIHQHEIDPKEHLPFSLARRQAILSSALAISLGNAASTQKSVAAVTDETNNFAMKDSAYVTPDEISSSNAMPNTTTSITTNNNENGIVSPLFSPTDEITITIPMSKLQSSPLGVELADVEFRTNRRVYIKSVLASSLGAQYNIQPNYILVKINGKSAERTDARGVAMMISQVKQQINPDDNLVLTFRKDSSFQEQLLDLSNVKEATTQIAPAGDTTQRNQDGSIQSGYRETFQQDDQRITVSQLIPPKMCRRGADIDDLLEISYVGTILETGAVFDGSAIKIDGMGIPGRGNDVSIFFVLGKQPFGQFPPGWDVGLRGICVGERRRLIVPPVLAYGSVGVPRRNIPPNATLVYDVTLVSLNGLATPQ